MSTHNVCFLGEVRQILPGYLSCLELYIDRQVKLFILKATLLQVYFSADIIGHIGGLSRSIFFSNFSSQAHVVGNL